MGVQLKWYQLLIAKIQGKKIYKHIVFFMIDEVDSKNKSLFVYKHYLKHFNKYLTNLDINNIEDEIEVTVKKQFDKNIWINITGTSYVGKIQYKDDLDFEK